MGSTAWQAKESAFLQRSGGLASTKDPRVALLFTKSGRPATSEACSWPLQHISIALCSAPPLKKMLSPFLTRKTPQLNST